jgi:hypothetical protein
MNKRGRPRRNLRDDSFARSDRPRLPVGDANFAWAFTAACTLHTLERGTAFEKARCDKFIHELRQSRSGLMVDPVRSIRDPAQFLERFIERYAPGWNWRSQIGDGGKKNVIRVVTGDRRRPLPLTLWRFERRRMIPTNPAKWATLIGKIYCGGSQSRNERIAKEAARMKRRNEARLDRFVTADEPDAGILNDLRHRITPTDPASWATLRELKLATAIPERSLKRIIVDLRPKTGEIVTVQRRHKFMKRGACPKRYGPRLVIGILGKFVNHLMLGSFQIDDVERQRLRKIAVTGKRSLTSKLGYFRSIT